MHDPERDIRDIPLSQLELSPANVRKTSADASAFTELKASIAAHGLLENLIARAMEPGTDCVARYAVIAGGRRLAAMQALAAEGALDEDHPVLCRMIGSIVAAEEVSLAENSVRAAMHPADQVEAFRRLADAGSTAAAIAARFGVSERTVEKRLRLGNAAPVLLEAYRAGEIDLETLMAFAVTTDQARQSAVWETVSQQGYRGTVGEAAAVEFSAFLQVWHELPHPRTVIDDPEGAVVPGNASALIALCGSLYRMADDINLGDIVTYATRLRREVGEFLVGSCIRREPALQHTQAFIQWAAAKTR